MRAALLAEYRAAIPAYDERARARWVFDYSAQNAVVVSRTFYTQEVRGVGGWVGEGGGGCMLGGGGVHCCCCFPPPSNPHRSPSPPHTQVNDAFEELEDGNEDALKGVAEKQRTQLRRAAGGRWGGGGGGGASQGRPCRERTPSRRKRLLLCAPPKPFSSHAPTPLCHTHAPTRSELIELINGDLSPADRKKLITLCTIDVHARDVAQRLVDERVDSGQCFQWQSQLRYSQGEKTRDCQVGVWGWWWGGCGAGQGRQGGEGSAARRLSAQSLCAHTLTHSPTRPPPPCLQVNICDAEIRYMWEYIGNCGCLCITPLTDRCYITLTQAQRLVLGARMGVGGQRVGWGVCGGGAPALRSAS